MRNEVWRDIPGYEGKYQVSNWGNIRSFASRWGTLRIPKILKPGLDSHGYKIVGLGGKSVLLHRCVAKAFLPNPDNLPMVNHKDENPQNNRVDNLEWCTRSYNCTYGNAQKWKFTPVKRTNINTCEIDEYSSIKDASESTGIPSTTIFNAIRRRSLCHGLYVWEYSRESKYTTHDSDDMGARSQDLFAKMDDNEKMQFAKIYTELEVAWLNAVIGSECAISISNAQSLLERILGKDNLFKAIESLPEPPKYESL